MAIPHDTEPGRFKIRFGKCKVCPTKDKEIESLKKKRKLLCSKCFLELTFLEKMSGLIDLGTQLNDKQWNVIADVMANEQKDQRRAFIKCLDGLIEYFKVLKDFSLPEDMEAGSFPFNTVDYHNIDGWIDHFQKIKKAYNGPD